MHLNIHSVYNKISNVFNLLKLFDVDIFCLNETWLSSYISSDELLLFGYQIFRVDLANMQKGIVNQPITRGQGNYSFDISSYSILLD